MGGAAKGRRKQVVPAMPGPMWSKVSSSFLGTGLTDVRAPEVIHTKNVKYIPHAFTSMELHNFFKACDSIDLKYNRLQSKLRKLQCPVFFRLLYSSGIRTTEARFLRVQDVDLGHGVLDIRKSKGYDQHYVALHETMTELLQRYESAIQKIQANRTYFFETSKGTHFSRDWVEDNFTALWKSANGTTGNVVAYDLRHNYATENINSWENDPFAASENLHFLSKSMGIAGYNRRSTTIPLSLHWLTSFPGRPNQASTR
jgi:integrase